MSQKVRDYGLVLWILLLGLLLVISSMIFHQFLLLSYIVLIYWVIMMLLRGIPYIHVGIKEVREARQNGESVSWRQNLHIIQGIFSGLLPLIMVASAFTSGYHPGNSHWPIIDVIDVILTICTSLFLIPVIFFEIVFTVGTIRYFLNHTNPYESYLQSISTEE